MSTRHFMLRTAVRTSRLQLSNALVRLLITFVCRCVHLLLTNQLSNDCIHYFLPISVYSEVHIVQPMSSSHASLKHARVIYLTNISQPIQVLTAKSVKQTLSYFYIIL